MARKKKEPESAAAEAAPSAERVSRAERRKAKVAADQPAKGHEAATKRSRRRGRKGDAPTAAPPPGPAVDDEEISVILDRSDIAVASRARGGDSGVIDPHELLPGAETTADADAAAPWVPRDFLEDPRDRSHGRSGSPLLSSRATEADEWAVDDSSAAGASIAATRSQAIEDGAETALSGAWVSFAEAFAAFGLGEGDRPDVDAWASTSAGEADLASPETWDSCRDALYFAPRSVQEELATVLAELEEWREDWLGLSS